MRLYFLRHADAVPGAPDEGRTLSELGKDQCSALGQFLHQSRVEFDLAFSSPLVRARETATRVLDQTNRDEPLLLQITESLSNETTGADFDRWLRSLKDARHILFVGHNPSLTDHVGRLIGGLKDGALDMPKAGLICLRTEDGRRFELKSFLPPRLYFR